eukprot:TRINITY_DN1956_c0_g1_i5.p2 TRINITY_DN1956_c0_g1~~TRINITY_DN1956_c0_g1_i5.p2  ORF type:complete len:196 (-),score=70.15 TRINITY_DN1956_c0_g1_i5:257-844(-)
MPIAFHIACTCKGVEEDDTRFQILLKKIVESFQVFDPTTEKKRSNYVVYEQLKYGFKLRVPPSPPPQENMFGSLVMLNLGQGEGGVPATFVVSGKKNQNFEQMLDNAQKELQMMKTVKDFDVQNITFTDEKLPAKEILFEGSLPLDETQALWMKSRAIIVIKGENSLNLSFSAPSDDFDRFYPEALAIFDHFTFV